MLGGNVFGAALGGHIGTRASELLDGRMTAEDEHRARLHLGHCRQCAIVMAAEQEARDVLRSMAMPTSLTPPPDLVAGLLALCGPSTPSSTASTAAVPPAALPSSPRMPVGDASTMLADQARPAAQPPQLHRSHRLKGALRGALAVSGLFAAGVTVAVTITSVALPPMQRQAGSVARSSMTTNSVSGPRAFTQASFSLESTQPGPGGPTTLKSDR